MIEIKATDEECILPRCLHGGPIQAAAGRAVEPADMEFPPHPWSDETIRDLVAERPDFSLCHTGAGFAGEFMREMIRRYGTCALLAWEGRTVTGVVRFYPMTIARLVAEIRPANRQPEPILDPLLACDVDEDEGTLWVHCVMTCPPYTGVIENPAPKVETDRHYRRAQDVGGRKGVGLRLARALIPWTREHGWKRMVRVATCDLDVFYGIWGGGGKGFWEKAGFRSIGTIYRPLREKGMTEQEVWTFHRVVCELRERQQAEACGTRKT